MNESDKKYYRIHRYSILLQQFSQENEMLTAKMSVRRNNIYKVCYVHSKFGNLENWNVVKFECSCYYIVNIYIYNYVSIYLCL